MTDPLKIFLTGATGYIGGDALFALMTAYPNQHYSCLVRDSTRAAPVAAQHPSVRMVYGTLDDTEILEREAANADIVLHCASADHLPSALALTTGLSRRATTLNKPTYYLHTSGSGILCHADLASSHPGEYSPKVFNDWDRLGEVTSLPDDAPHRPVDKLVLAAGSSAPPTSNPPSSDTTTTTTSTPTPSRLHTAILAPPTIYGLGRGSSNKTSMQLEGLVRDALSRRGVITVGPGTARWSNIHIRDVSALWVLLVGRAISNQQEDANDGIWGKEGYYFVEGGEHSWLDIARQIAKIMHTQDLVDSEKIASVTGAEAETMHKHGRLLWGTNSRCRAVRARRLLGWQPVGARIEEEVVGVVDREVELRRSS